MGALLCHYQVPPEVIILAVVIAVISVGEVVTLLFCLETCFTALLTNSNEVSSKELQFYSKYIQICTSIL